MVGPSIAVMKGVVKDSGFGGDFRPVLPRKKRKGNALEKNVGNKERSAKEPSGIKIKKALGKPLRKINFTSYGDMNDVLSDGFLELPLSLKNLVNVSVQKSFALDIRLDKVAEKSSQDKFSVVKKLFSEINSFGRASTLSKFSGIICVTFTFELGLMKATEKTTGAKILVNANLKRSIGHSDWAVVLKKIPIGTSVETVCIVLSKYGVVVLIKIQLVGLWQKAVVKFDKSKLAAIYAKCLALVAHLIAFGGISWAKIAGESLFSLPLFVHNNLVNSGSFLEMRPILSVIFDIEKRFAVLESSFTSLVRQISKLAKRLDPLMLAVFQLSPGCQLPMTPPLQDQVGNVVIEKGSDRITDGRTAANLDSSVFPKIKRLENILEELSALVLSLTAKFDGLILAGNVFFKPSS
ncbi:hypothetical protein G9A89_021580 [Geosiphon pyriformis]|nr:hypothetical protein G9A89_021580 [Geosiphon pyriformis]